MLVVLTVGLAGIHLTLKRAANYPDLIIDQSFRDKFGYLLEGMREVT